MTNTQQTSELWKVTHDGKVVFEGKDENECWVWIHKHQGQSVHWAMKYCGYRIVKATAQGKE